MGYQRIDTIDKYFEMLEILNVKKKCLKGY